MYKIMTEINSFQTSRNVKTERQFAAVEALPSLPLSLPPWYSNPNPPTPSSAASKHLGAELLWLRFQ